MGERQTASTAARSILKQPEKIVERAMQDSGRRSAPGPDEEAMNETIADAHTEMPSDALAPEKELPEPSDEEVEKAAEALGAKRASIICCPLKVNKSRRKSTADSVNRSV